MRVVMVVDESDNNEIKRCDYEIWGERKNKKERRKKKKTKKKKD